MSQVTFVYDQLIVSTTVDADDDDQAVSAAAEIVTSYGLNPSRAFEIQIDGDSYQGDAV